MFFFTRSDRGKLWICTAGLNIKEQSARLLQRGEDSNNLSASIINPTSSVNSGNNTNWFKVTVMPTPTPVVTSTPVVSVTPTPTPVQTSTPTPSPQATPTPQSTPTPVVVAPTAEFGAAGSDLEKWRALWNK